MAELAGIRISGAPRTRGQQHGEGLRALVHERDRRWKAEIGETTGLPPARFIEEFLEATRFTGAILANAPDLLEEVRGLAEGANLEFADVLAAQFMDEEWWFAEKYRNGRHHCSSLGWVHPTSGSALIAQTMDLPAWMDGYQTLLTIHTEETGLVAHVLTVAGMIGLCGVNSAGLALAVNTLSDLSSDAAGLPVAFVARRILAHSGHDQALAFLTGVIHASGQNYIVADRRQLSDMECSARTITRFKPTAGNEHLVWHANHAIANKDRRAAGEREAGRRNSEARMAALDRLLSGASRIDLERATAILGDSGDARHPICRRLAPDGAHPGRYFSFASVIWEIGDTIVAHVAPGPLGDAPMQSFALDPVARPIAAD